MQEHGHYFNLTFGVSNGTQNGVINRVVRFDHPRVSHAQLEAIRASEQLDDRAPLLSVSYLGRMTPQQWETDLWEAPQPAPSHAPVSATAWLCLGLGVIVVLAAAAALIWVLLGR